MKKKIIIAVVFAVTAIMLFGCKNEEKYTESLSPVETHQIKDIYSSLSPSVQNTKTPIPVSHEGEVKSRLTGEWVKKEQFDKRPYAIMLNNIKVANPQTGISDASILYEALAEGGITRMMGIYENPSLKKIGSVRSARHYFVSFADEYDAIYVHYGHTKYATAKIKQLQVDNLSGLSGLGTTIFFRDNEIKAPHNAFTSADGIRKGTKALHYRTTIRKDIQSFDFYSKNNKMKGIKANKVKLNFSKYTTPYFVYNKKMGVYYRFQYGTSHIDRRTGKQLMFKNLIIQLVKEWNIDHNGYQTMSIENAAGEGYYLTNGNAMKITWVKNESSKSRIYYDNKGKKLKINTGKTYIAVYPENRVPELVFS